MSEEVNGSSGATNRRRPLLIGLAAILVVALAGGALLLSQPRLSDAQSVWCQQHQMTPLSAITILGPSAFVDDAVLKAAEHLGITVPAEISKADSIFGLENSLGDPNLMNGLPTDWTDVMDTWMKTSDYARACIAAFEAR
jgi:hypothetical protein